MASNKLNRTNEDIKYHLSRLLPQVKDPRVRQGELVTITRVETTGDLRYCKVYLSVLGTYHEKEFRRGLKSAAPWLRRELGGAMRLRYTPELIFETDKSMEHGERISRLLQTLDIPEEEETDDGI